MTEQHGAPRQRDDVAAVDVLYRPFPDLSSWPRLGPFQRDLWARFSSELNEQKGRATAEQLARAVTVALRAAAIDTGAIEGLYQVDRGFTMSVALQTLTWEHALGERGEGVRELFEAQLAGYELAIDAVTGKTPLSEAWLRSLHERICAPQATYRALTEMGWQEQPFQKGRYKALPNHVRLADGSYHASAPVADVAPEMRRLFEQLCTPAFAEAHPVEQAAYAHYALTAVHPFAIQQGFVAQTQPPIPSTTISIIFRVNIARDDVNPFRFRLEALSSQDVLDVREEDVAPAVTASLSLRLDQWVQRQWTALLVDREHQARAEQP